MSEKKTHVSINRVNFLEKLQAISPGLAKREVVEQSNCYVFTDGNIITYNDLICCRIQSDLPTAFKGAVAASPLVTLLEKMSEDDLTVEIGDGELIVSGKRRTAGIRMEHQITLPINLLEEPDKWKKVPLGFDDAINIVASCASSSGDKHVLSCIHVTPDYLEALDNTQLCRLNIQIPVKQRLLIKGTSLVPAASLGMTRISESPSWMHLKNKQGLIYSCRLFMDEFPDLSPYLTVKGDKITLPGSLRDAVMKAEIFSKENTGTDKVQITIKTGKIIIKGEGSLGWFRETIKLPYKGEDLTFMVRPAMLREIVKRNNECTINPTRLKIDGDNYRYVSCLSKVKQNDETKEPAPVES